MNLINKLKQKSCLLDCLVFTCFFLFSGCLSVYYGIERNYDTRNYHIYNPWAFLTGRVGYDTMPAGIQSYFNPLLDVPYYLAVKYLNDYPTLITFLMGFGYAFFLFMVYKIARLIFKDFHQIVLTVLSIYVASGIKFILRWLGWLSHDIFLGALVLLSLYLLLKAFEKKNASKIIFWSGFILGACVGLKYTTAIFAVPMGITFLIFYKQFEKPIKSFSFFCLGGLVGFLLADAWWMLLLYQAFGNPLFPYFNWLIPSGDITSSDVFSVDFGHLVPKGIRGILFHPLRASETRFKVLWWGTLINFFTLPFVNKEKFKKIYHINIRHTDFILIFCCMAYFLWINTFATTRYYIPLLGMIVIVSVVLGMKLLYMAGNFLAFLPRCLKILRKIKFEWIKNIFLLGIFLFFIISYPPKFTRFNEKKLIRFPIEKKILEVENLNFPNSSFVFLSGGAGILLPFQNPAVKYLKLNPLEFSKKGLVLFSDKKIKQIKTDIQKSEKLFILSASDLNSEKKPNIQKIKSKLESALKEEKKKEELKKLLKIHSKIASDKKKKLKIPSEKEIHKELKKKIGLLSRLESTLLELDRLGIDTENIQCRKISTNMIDPKNQREHTYYVCQLKKIDFSEDSYHYTTNEIVNQ